MARLLYHIARADFLERVRRYSFLITLGITVYAAYLFVPPNNSPYATLQIGGHRGVYNSAWIGALVAMMTSVFLSFVGFYLTKNCLRRDRETGVGEIIATTPVGKFQYTLGKTLSNFAVLAVIVGVTAVAAAGMQLLRGEDYHISPWPLLSPFLLITLPVMAVVAGVAVLFETIPRLRGGLGNVVYFFLWTFAVSSVLFSRFDPFGQGYFLPHMMKACDVAFTDFAAASENFSIGFNFRAVGAEGGTWQLTTFVWNGVPWPAAIVLERFAWFAMAFGVALLASLFFDRFDSTRVAPVPAIAVPGRKPGRRTWPWNKQAVPDLLEAVPRSDEGAHRITTYVGLTPLVDRRPRFRLVGVAKAEWRLITSGRSSWWKMTALGLIVAGLFSPVDIGRRFLLPAAWIWPILVWSSMGTREARYSTDQIVFSTPRPLLRHLPATWLVGVIVTMLTGSGVAIRLAIAGDMPSLFAWSSGALFIPTMALALGVVSGSGKLFEVLYLILWYIGPVNRIPTLDYMGATTQGMAEVYLGITVILVAVAWVGRWWQLRR